MRFNKIYVLASLLVLVLSTAIFAQRRVVTAQQKVDYNLREKNAPAAIKTKLLSLRNDVKAKRLTFSVGYTIPMDRNLDNLTGDIIPENMESRARLVNARAAELIKIDREEERKFNLKYPGKLPRIQIACTAGLRRWDWRKRAKVTPVKDQMSCGSCWSFAVIGALESSYMIRNNLSTDESEQYVLANSGAGSCAGGNRESANIFLVSTGTAREEAVPYTATSGPPNPGVTTPYDAVATGFVNPSVQNPSVADLKRAMCQYGPLSVSVNATPLFQAYTGGVFNEGANSSTNHAVLLIGWDDDKGAWLIKNSWGNGWGSTAGYGDEKGYMWIAYNSNRVGRWAQWIKAKSTFYRLPVTYYTLAKKPILINPSVRRPIVRNK